MKSIRTDNPLRDDRRQRIGDALRRPLFATLALALALPVQAVSLNDMANSSTEVVTENELQFEELDIVPELISAVTLGVGEGFEERFTLSFFYFDEFTPITKARCSASLWALDGTPGPLDNDSARKIAFSAAIQDGERTLQQFRFNEPVDLSRLADPRLVLMIERDGGVSCRATVFVEGRIATE